MKIGFTGSRKGMTYSQKRSFQILVVKFLSPEEEREFHDGDCIGADDDAHRIVANLSTFRKIQIVGHPSTLTIRAGNTFDTWYPEKPPLVRNRDIVDVSDILIACPAGETEVVRSGTWATVRYAEAAKKPIVIIWPDGTMEDRLL